MEHHIKTIIVFNCAFIEKHIIVSKYKIYPNVKYIVEDWENVD